MNQYKVNAPNKKSFILTDAFGTTKYYHDQIIVNESLANQFPDLFINITPQPLREVPVIEPSLEAVQNITPLETVEQEQTLEFTEETENLLVENKKTKKGNR
jgi:hypothetical protein